MDALPLDARLESWRFDLPQALIAQVPAPARDGSRLMMLPRLGGAPVHARFADLPRWLRPGDVLVVNDTRVVPARIFATKETGGRVELLVLDRHPETGEPGRFPVSWCKSYGAGRVFYTSLGHRQDMWNDDPGLKDRKNDPAVSKAFQNHVLGGIEWALGIQP